MNCESVVTISKCSNIYIGSKNKTREALGRVKKKHVRLLGETSIPATVPPALFRKSVSQRGRARTAWAKTVVTGRECLNEDTISSTESVNVSDHCGFTEDGQLHLSAIEDTNCFIVEICCKHHFSFARAVQPVGLILLLSVNEWAFVGFRALYLAESPVIKSNSGQNSYFGAWIFKDSTYIHESREFMESELCHYESPRMSLSHTEPVPPGARDLHLSIFRLDNKFFSIHWCLERLFVADWTHLSLLVV